MALLLATSCTGESGTSVGLDQAVTPIAPELEQQMKAGGPLGQLCFTSRDLLYALVDMGLIPAKYPDQEDRIEAFSLTRARLVNSLDEAERDLPTVLGVDPAMLPYYERLMADVTRAKDELDDLPSSHEHSVDEAIETTADTMRSIFDFDTYPAYEVYEAAIQADDEACPPPS